MAHKVYIILGIIFIFILFTLSRRDKFKVANLPKSKDIPHRYVLSLGISIPR